MTKRVERGSCFCGAILAQVEGQPFWINYDHDDDCRKALGSPLTIWIGYNSEDVSFTRGSPKVFSKTPGVERWFCADCGSSIAYVDHGLRNEIWITIGFMDEPQRFMPQAHGHWSLKLPWIELADELPRMDSYTRVRDPVFGNPDQRKTNQRPETA